MTNPKEKEMLSNLARPDLANGLEYQKGIHPKSVPVETGLKPPETPFTPFFFKLKAIRLFIPQSDLLEKHPLLDPEILDEYYDDLTHLLSESRHAVRLNALNLLEINLAANERWLRIEKEMSREIFDFEEKKEILDQAIRVSGKDLFDRIKDLNERRVSVAAGKVLAAVAGRWFLVQSFLESLHLVAVHPNTQNILPYQLYPQIQQLTATNQRLLELKNAREEGESKYQQTKTTLGKNKRELEQPLLKRLSRWVAVDRDRTIIFILSHPEEIEKWTSIYLGRGIEGPTQEEVLTYLTWALKNYHRHHERVDHRLFDQWVLQCFPDECLHEVKTLLSSEISLVSDNTMVQSLNHFAEHLKHPDLAKDFSQFLGWWLNSELNYYGLPVEEKEEPPYFITRTTRRKKLYVLPQEKDVFEPSEKIEEPLKVLVGQIAMSQEELEAYLLTVLGPTTGREIARPVSSRVFTTAGQIEASYFSPHFRLFKEHKLRLELNADGRIKCPKRWRALATLVSRNGTTTLKLVGIIHRDWGYDKGRMIPFN